MTREEMLRNAVTEACRTMMENPDDSIQDIFNEAFASWQLGLKMDIYFNIEKQGE